ncbi:MAG: tetratricopeptide repeat protein [Polyangia bacterium]
MKRSVQMAMVALLAAAVPGKAFADAGAAPAHAPVDQKELDGMAQAAHEFETATQDYRGTVRHVVQQEYTVKRKALMGRYQQQIDKSEQDEKDRRMAAITLFENFLSKYSHDDRWTPDAMFRLAELYFEKSNDEYLTATQQAGAAGAQVTPDYNKTVAIYKDLITRFPGYRLIDGAYYLLGWCEGEMNQEGQSLQAMRALVCSNKYKPLDPPAPFSPSKGKALKVKVPDPYLGCVPIKKDSRFLPEAWTRIGETHFDESELELAIAAYKRVLDYPDSPYYDKALYKLAWSYYRNDNYPDAIKRFDDLVVYSDKKKAESGEEGSDLRTESVQYLGISFAEKDWNGDSIDDTETGLERIEKFYQGRDNEPHVREVYAKLGDIYFDETEYFHAIEVYRAALAKWPYDPANPKLQDRIVMAFERQRDFGNALKARDELARNYTRGTEWYKHNRDNKEAIDKANELAELALVSAAVNHHKAAQDLKKLAAASKHPTGAQLEAISKEYGLAAEAYQKYLEQYPNSKNTYEYSYSYAETLYFSGRFLDAAAQYEKVRDSLLDNKYAEDAAFNAVKSYEKYLEMQTQAGKYVEPPLPADGKTAVPVTPIAIPDPVARLQKAYDAFVQRVPSSGRVPTMAYKAAEIDYRYLHWDTARPRMEKVLGTYCKADVGADAGNAILVSYTIEKNLDKISEWANKLKTMSCGSTEVAQKNAGDLGKLILGVKFKKADQLFADKKYEDAAALYIQIVDSDPKNEDADKALNNAAVAYENVKRFGAATKLYERIVTEYPNSKFVDDALFRTAVSYQKAFEFDKAVVSYERLAQDSRFANSTHRTDALYNAAVILENDQDYAKAADLFKKYAADRSVKPTEAGEALFRAGLIYQKMKDPGKTLATFKQYLKTFGASNSGRAIEANFRMAEAFEVEHNRRAADDQYRRVVSMGFSVMPASDAAEYPAHAAFILAEEKLPAVEKEKISGGGKHLVGSINAFKKNVGDLVAEYNKVLTYKRASWTLAAYFRTGYLFETFSKALLAAPCPPEVKRLGQDACDIYGQQIEQVVAGVDDEAVKRYGVTLQKAGEMGVSNQWTKLARLKANAYKPDVFPLTKDEHIDMQMENP